MPESRHPHPSLPVNLVHKAALIEQQWSPRVVAEMNDYQFKVVRIEGEFIWHAHPETDEAFLVLEGTLRIDLPDGCVHVNPGGTLCGAPRRRAPDRCARRSETDDDRTAGHSEYRS